MTTDVFFTIGGISVRWYALTILFGIVAGYFLMAKPMKAHGYKLDTTDELLLLCLIFGLLGGRLAWLLEHTNNYRMYLPYIFAISDGGFDILGVLFGICAIVFIYCVRRKMSFLRTLDVITPAVMLFAVIARIGRSFSEPTVWLANGLDLIGFLLIYFMARPYSEGRRRGDVTAFVIMWLGLSRLVAMVLHWDSYAEHVLLPAFIAEALGLALYVRIHLRKPTKPIILFDMDGTLMNSRYMVLQCFTYLYKKYSNINKFTPEIQKEIFGPPIREELAKLFPDQDTDMLMDEYLEYQSSFSWKDEVSLFPNTKSTIETLAEEGYDLGIVSSRLRSSSESWLRQMELDHCFKVIIGRDNVENNKPDPEGIVAAGKRLKRGHDSCIYVGDSINDVEMGKAAGVYVVSFISDATRKDAIDQAYPNKEIADLKDLLEIVQERHEWSYEKV